MSRLSIERVYKDFVIRRNQSINDIRCTETREIGVIRQHFRKLKIKVPKDVSNLPLSVLIDHGLSIVLKDDNVFLEVPFMLNEDQFDDQYGSTLYSNVKMQHQQPLQSTFLGKSHVKPFLVDVSSITPEMSIEKLIKERNSSLAGLNEKRDRTIREIRDYFAHLVEDIPESLLSTKVRDLEIIFDTGESKR